MFVKGQSGNPNGRPKTGQAIAEAARRMLAATDETGQRNVDAVLAALITAAKGGNVQAAKVLFDRAEGAPVAVVSDSDIIVRIVGDIDSEDEPETIEEDAQA